MRVAGIDRGSSLWSSPFSSPSHCLEHGEKLCSHESHKKKSGTNTDEIGMFHQV